MYALLKLNMSPQKKFKSSQMLFPKVIDSKFLNLETIMKPYYFTFISLLLSPTVYYYNFMETQRARQECYQS